MATKPPQKRAVKHGRTKPDRKILKSGLATSEPAGNPGTEIHALFAPFGGVDLPEIPDEPIEPILFDE